MEYGAIDLHKKESQIRILREGGEIIDRRIATTRDRLTAVFWGRPRMRALNSTRSEGRRSTSPSNNSSPDSPGWGQVTSERVEQRAHRVVVDPPRLDNRLASARLVLLRFYIFSSRSFRTLPDSERYPLSFTQLIKARRDTAGLMKKVFRTVRRSDEPKAFVCLALDRTGGRCHAYISSISSTE